jgi:hypothetical protein
MFGSVVVLHNWTEFWRVYKSTGSTNKTEAPSPMSYISYDK